MSIKRGSLSAQGKVTKITVLLMLECKCKHQAYHHQQQQQQHFFYVSIKLGF
jgi:hypothetical protein